jgi:hypothetical protein
MKAGNNCVVYLKRANNVTFTHQPEFRRRSVDSRDQHNVIVFRKQRWKARMELNVYAASRMNRKVNAGECDRTLRVRLFRARK